MLIKIHEKSRLQNSGLFSICISVLMQHLYRWPCFELMMFWLQKPLSPPVGHMINNRYLQWNLSVTTTSIMKFITCDLLRKVF